MKMKGAKKLVIWYDENVRVTLDKNEKGERLAKGRNKYTQRAPAKSISRTTFWWLVETREA
jgi:hypothetical protein